MKTSAITKLWISGSIVLVVGGVAAGISLALMLAYGGHFVPAASGSGSDFIPNLDQTFWTTVSVLVSGCAIAALGVLLQAVAWIGAMINTFPLADKTWFVILLASGLLGLGFPLVAFAGMIAYLVAGPPRLPAVPLFSPTASAPVQGT